MDRPLRMNKKPEDIVPPVNTHQKVTSTEEDSNKQMHRMTHSLGTSLFSATPSSLSVCKRKVAIGAGTEIKRGPSNVLQYVIGCYVMCCFSHSQESRGRNQVRGVPLTIRE